MLMFWAAPLSKVQTNHNTKQTKLIWGGTAATSTNQPATSTNTSRLYPLCLSLQNKNTKIPKRTTVTPTTTPAIMPVFGLLESPIHHRQDAISRNKLENFNTFESVGSKEDMVQAMAHSNVATWTDNLSTQGWGWPTPQFKLFPVKLKLIKPYQITAKEKQI